MKEEEGDYSEEDPIDPDSDDIDFFGIAFDFKSGDDDKSLSGLLSLKKVGPYLIERSLGRGGFGEVFLAHDESLQRKVALKVINHGAFGDSDEKLLEEGQTLAQLNHPGIVKVHSAGKWEGKIYFVSEFLEGKTLGEILNEGAPPLLESVALVEKIAHALNYAHENGVVHRDIKPNNVIVTPEGQPVLIDFGIALAPGNHAGDQNRGIFGTPSYMSPEQARGEGHLVDGRTDIYSLGVILYGLLTHQSPFEGDSEYLIEQVGSFSLPAPAPREINPKIPRALERICLKALSKRTGDRYKTAGLFAQELSNFSQALSPQSSAENTTVKLPIIPKGLRSFDGQDAGFFLQLLPGVKDREGIPDSIRFWQREIENAVDPFRVGVLYGPSGSGKSSFLKAGLVPLLPTNIEVITIAGDISETELILNQSLKNRFPDLSEDMQLDECIRTIREKQLLPEGNKLLIIVDQFEQWLHAHRPGTDVELVSALRQCDGFKLQVILTLRDDFWMGIGKLMEDIDVPLLQTKNCAALDLFDIDHARNVLIKFGHAYGRLPGIASELSKPESRFIESALSELSQNGKIVPVQLSLFADITKELSWSGDSLKKLGGVSAIGSRFLNASFSERGANPANRMLENKARGVLEALLPEGDTPIRNPPLSERLLRERAGFEPDDSTFESTITILERELRLIALVEDELLDSESDSAKKERHFQLTHDYLVPFLRDWVFETKRSTARGRAALRFTELSALYERFPGNGHLPTFLEWLRFATLTKRSTWTDLQKKMMKAISKRISLWALLFATMVTVTILVTNFYKQEAAIGQLFSDYMESPTPVAENLIQKLSLRPDKFRGLANDQIAHHPEASREWLNLAAYLVAEDHSFQQPLFERGLDGSFDEFKFVINRLEEAGSRESINLWDRLARPSLPSSSRLRIAAALATLDPEAEQWSEWNDDAARLLVTLSPADVVQWLKFFVPVQEQLEPALLESFGSWLENTEGNVEAEPSESVSAAAILSRFYSDQPESLLELLDKASPEQLPFVIGQIAFAPSFPDDLIRRRLARNPSAELPASNITTEAKAILALNKNKEYPELWQSLQWSPELDNRLRPWLIYLGPKAGIKHEILLSKLQDGKDPTVISAVLLMLGSYNSDSINFQKPQVEQQVITLFTSHPNSLVHSSARWLLTRWGWHSQDLNRLISDSPQPANSSWSYNSNGHAMIKVRLPDSSDKPQGFELAMTETTVEQYRAFASGYSPFDNSSPDSPVDQMSSETAMAYCNWLSKKEGYEDSQLCYENYTFGGVKRWREVENHYEKPGYRLPSREEFFYAASGSVEGAGFGPTEAVWLKDYAWFLDNSDGKHHGVGRLKPTGFGIYDAVGNLLEWCHNRNDDHYLIMGSAYRSPRWALSLTKNIHTTASSLTPISTFRIARTLKPH